MRNILLISAAILCLGLASCNVPSGSKVKSGAGEFPSFNLKMVEGGTLDYEVLKGKPLVVNFWATW